MPATASARARTALLNQIKERYSTKQRQGLSQKLGKRWNHANDAQLRQWLGIGAAPKAKAKSKAKPQLTAKRYETAKQSGAVAQALKAKLGLDDMKSSEIESKLRGNIKKAVDRARKKGADDKGVRAAALLAVKATVAELKGHQVPGKEVKKKAIAKTAKKLDKSPSKQTDVEDKETVTHSEKKAITKSKKTTPSKTDDSQRHRPEAPAPTKNAAPSKPDEEAKTQSRRAEDLSAELAAATPSPPPKEFSPTSYNPHAIPDLKLEDFHQYKLGRDIIERQNEPEAAWNLPYEGWKKHAPQHSNRLGDYRQRLSTAITSGVDVSDSVLKDSGLKLNKATQNKLAQNRKELSDHQAHVDRIQKAIDFPVMTDADAKGYKPKMSESEATEYTHHSFMGGIDFYHGNQDRVINSVVKDGVKPEKNDKGIYGQGFYMAISKEEAEGYALTNTSSGSAQAGIISSKLKTKNPYIANAQDIEAIGTHFPGDQGNCTDSKSVTEFLRAKGYDSIYMKDHGYFVAFDGRQVATHEAELLKPERMAQITERYEKSEQTWSAVDERAFSTSGGKKLKQIKHSEDQKYEYHEDFS